MSDKESSDGSQAGDRKGMKGRFLNTPYQQLFKTPSFLKANNNNTHVQAKEVKKLNWNLKSENFYF